MAFQSTNTPPEAMLDFLSKHVDLCTPYGQNNIVIGKNLAHDLALLLREVINIDLALARRPALDGIQHRFDKIVKCINTAAQNDPNDNQAEYIKLLEEVEKAANNASEKLHSIAIRDGFDAELLDDAEFDALQVAFIAVEKFREGGLSGILRHS